MQPQSAPSPIPPAMSPIPEVPSAGIPPQYTPAPASPTLELLPSEWPGAFGSYKYAQQATKINIWTLIGLYAMSFVIFYIFSLFIPLVGVIFGNISSTIFSIAVTVMLISGVRGLRMDIGVALKRAFNFKLFIRFIFVSILAGMAICFGFILFIIPGIFLLPRLILAPYFTIDKNLGISASLQASWDSTKGHFKKIWGVLLLAIGMLLLSVTIIGIPFAIYFLIMYSSSLALLYYFITQQSGPSEVTLSPPAQQSPPSSSGPTTTPPGPIMPPSAPTTPSTPPAAV